MRKDIFRKLNSNQVSRELKAYSFGFTLIELVLSIAIVATLATITIPVYSTYQDKARIARAIAEIRAVEKEITVYQLGNNAFPDNLDQIGRGTLLDPWGNPYEYLNIASGGVPKGKMRRDRFMVPVNTDYDLYSRGKDGLTQTPFTAASARDDIVRANDGEYVGLASEF